MGHVHVDLASRTATASADNLQGPNSYVEISSDNLKKIRDGQLNPAMALMTRKIKVRGDLELVGKVAKLMRSPWGLQDVDDLSGQFHGTGRDNLAGEFVTTLPV
jgi:Putative sterol carrier protein